MVVVGDFGLVKRVAPLFVPLALLLGAPACSNDAGDSLAGGGDDGDGNGFADDGVGGTSGADDGGFDGGDDDGGPAGGDEGGDDGSDADAPVPEDVKPGDEDPDTCDTDEDVKLFLSPDDSNSMSSPVQARGAALDDFGSIKSVPIRTWEFLNYYGFDYDAPEPGEGVALYTDLIRPEGAEDGEYVMQIGIASAELTPETRDPIALTLVLDTSGSMEGQAMDMLKESCRAIASSLKEGDKVSMVTWDTQNSTVLGGYTVDGPNDTTVVGKCDGLEAGGGTNLHGGLTSGYALAEEVFQEDITNRIVLISDGGANAGVTDVDIIAEHAGGNDADGIYMVGVGVGSAGSYNDDLMDVVTDAGKGASVFIGDEAEAWKVFGEDFISTMGVAARDVQVRLDMPPGFEVVRFSGEEISEDPAEVEPQHLAPSDTMVFHQHIATCAPDLVETDTEFTVTASYRDAKNFESREVSQTFTFGEMVSADHDMLLKGAAVFEYAEGLKALQLGEEDDPLAAARAALLAAREALPEDEDLAEIADVLDAL